MSALRFAVGPGLALGSAGVTVAGEKLSVPGSQSGTGQARMMPAFIFQSNQAPPPPGEGSPRTGGARGRGGLVGAARPLSPLLLLFDFHTCRFRDVSFWSCAGLTAKSGGKSRASTQSPALTQPPAADVQDQSGLGDAAGGPVWTRRWPADGMTIAPGAVRSAGHRWRNLPVVLT